MLQKNDRRLLIFPAILVVLGFVIATTGITTSPLHLWAVSVDEGLISILIHAGYLGWYFVLIYVFSAPGWRRAAQALLPGLVLATLYLTITQPALSIESYLLITGCLVGAYLPILLTFQRRLQPISSEYGDKINSMLFLWTAIVLLALLPPTYLGITASLYPTTFDLPLYHFESTLGFLPSAVLASFVVDAAPAIQKLVRFAYSYLPLGFAVLLGMQLARADRPAINLLAAWLISDFVAIVGFHLLPVAGPKFLFLDMFPSNLPSVDELPMALSLVMPAPRNGVPSMHFAWALLLWLNANLLGTKWLRAGATLLLVMNFIATLGLGEHYLVDLIVSVPVVVAVQALCTTALPWAHPTRRRAIMWGAGMWLAWLVALRFGIPVFKAVPGLSWITMAATVGASIWLYRPLVRAFKGKWAKTERPVSTSVSVKPPANRELRLVAALFVVSGVAGLMYEVVFSKALALTFGSTATATYTVLATYMGGIAIGSWLGGRIAAGRGNPLVLYAFCELGIALYCVLTPAIFKSIQTVYTSMAVDLAPDAPILTAFRLLLGVGALLIPTILMGMTLPVLARFFEQHSRTLGKSVAVLYAANTIGAALGALMTGYFVIAALGVYRTTLLAALLNFLVAYVAFRLHKNSLAKEQRGDHRRALIPERSPVEEIGTGAAARVDAAHLRRLGYIALAILGIGGVVTLALEIKYIHLLAVVAGNSTYAFSLMLFTFLLGLGSGSEVARWLLKRDFPPGLVLGWLEFGLAIVILVGVFSWNDMPNYFASFADYPVEKGFAFREVVRGVVCWLAMFPPTLFIGAIYPIAMECIGRANPNHAIRSLGYAAALNTLGNIVGVLLGAFVLLPYLGALRSIQLLAAACMVLGASALWWSTAARRRPVAWVPAGIALVLLAVQPTSFNYDRLASGANVYFASRSWGKVIDHAESIDGGLTSVSLDEKRVPPLRTLLTNGKFQGNDSVAGEMQAQIGFSFAPLLHTAHREHALVIGFGTGASARTLHAAGFSRLDVVDLSADIVRLANEHFASVNDHVAEKSGVSTFITDGRNFLMLQDRRYDLVGIEISSIWFAGAAALYNREFYQLVKNRLYPHGVLQQWVQLHHIDSMDVMRILGSVRTEFQYVWLYLIGGQGIIVATNDATAVPKRANVELLKRTSLLQPLLTILGEDPIKLLDTRLLDPADTDHLLNALGVPSTYWVSTDDNLALEYSTPKGNALDGPQSFMLNKQFIARYSGRLPEAAKKTRNKVLPAQFLTQ